MAEHKNENLKFDAHENPKVSIIIPVYNQLEYTLQCLQSIKNAKDATTYEVIVIDDCSTDETERVVSKIKGIVYHRNKENLGFVKNNNLAADLAKGEYLYLLNNDTKVKNGYLEWLLKVFETNPNAAVVGSKLIYPDGRLQEAGGIIFSDGRAWNYGMHHDPDGYNFNFVREVDYCSGAAILIKRDLFIELGKFDEQFCPAYCEDSDFQTTARENGYKIFYQPKSVVVHYEGTSNGKDLGDQTTGIKKYQAINKEKFYRKHKAFLSDHNHVHTEPSPNPGIVMFPKWKENIYIFDDHLLTPDQDSGSQKFYNFMKILQERFQVTFLVRDPFHPVDDFNKYYDMLAQLGVRVVMNKGKRRAVDIRHFLTENKGQPKYIVLSRPEVAIKYFAMVKELSDPDVKILYDTADMHHLRMQTQIEFVKKNSPDNIDTIRHYENYYSIYRATETFILRHVDQIWAITQEEKDYMLSTLGIDPNKIVLVPNVLDVTPTENGYDKRKDMMFIGGYEHTPNVDAIVYFVAEIAPELKKRGIDIELKVLGSKAHLLGKLSSDMMDIIGFVEDPIPYFNDCLVAFYPLLTGAGMKGKITQALGLGLPVVTTDIGAQGYIGAEEYMYIGNTTYELVDRIEEVLKDKAGWERKRQKALEYFDDNLSFNAVRKVFNSL